MSELPILSIVTPTRGNFSEYWLEQLLKIQGDVEFILVYPPSAVIRAIDDSRLKTITSPYKGEVIQRLTGLLNASGAFVIALDDDDFLHPNVLQLTTDYFEKFPQSWVLRLQMKKIDYTNEAEIKQDWQEIPNIADLEIVDRRQNEAPVLQTIPIAPLKNHFDFRYFVGPYLDRKDQHGAHIENFNNKIWKSELVKQTLVDLLQTTRLVGVLVWMPLWNLDRLLGLYLQAKFFEEGRMTGHWLKTAEQVRYIKMPQTKRQEFRLMLPADALLVKRFPHYGYFWNLFFDQGWVAIRKIASNIIPRKSSESP
jgi:glycosyltransferase involved in cell wall biosynthesis